MLDVGHSEPDLDAFQAGERDDLSCRGLRHLDAIEALVGEQPGDSRLLALLRWIQRQQRDGITDVHRPPLDATNAEASEVGRVIDRRDQHLKWTYRVAGRRRDVLHDSV